MTDKLFIRLGILFIVFTPIAMTPYYIDKTAARRRDGTKIDGYSDEQKDGDNWTNAFGDCMGGYVTESQRAEWARREIRMALIDASVEPDELPLDQYPESVLRWLVADLEARPLAYRYNVKCIRLLGAIKNYLKSLDSAESGGILQVLPEQQQQQRETNHVEPRADQTGSGGTVE